MPTLTGTLSYIGNLIRPTRTRVVHRTRTIRAGYDSAKTGRENANHWAAADDLGPVTANRPEVRAVIRKRARYERDNNPHLNATLKTYAHNLVGTGPRLSLQLPARYHASARLVEQSFAAWARAASLMAEVRPTDGDAFALLVNNDAIRNAVKLDLRLVEAEQVATPSFDADADGIEYDASGNPTFYHVLRDHPGDGFGYGADYDRVAARYVLHWFRRSRPGQRRGVCELASSIGVGAQFRRYAQAVLTKAEVSANIAGVMETEATVPGDDTPTVETMEEVDFPRGSLLTLPGGYKAKTFDNGSTTTGFREYQDVMLGALGRPLTMGRNLTTGDSSSFNFASGKLDLLPFQQTIWIERDVGGRSQVLDPLFLQWLVEARGLGLVPDDLPAVNEWSWEWHWDGFPSINPEKDESARESRMKNRVSTLAEECAAEGKNWRDVVDQLALERDYLLSKGFAPDPAEPPPQPRQPVPAAGPDDEQPEPPEEDQ